MSDLLYRLFWLINRLPKRVGGDEVFCKGFNLPRALSILFKPHQTEQALMLFITITNIVEQGCYNPNMEVYNFGVLNCSVLVKYLLNV